VRDVQATSRKPVANSIRHTLMKPLVEFQPLLDPGCYLLRLSRATASQGGPAGDRKETEGEPSASFSAGSMRTGTWSPDAQQTKRKGVTSFY
jgi:hypothetical protein